MAKDKAPAFQFYPKDWQSDERVRLMSYTERGMYMDLLCHCWLEGSIPAEPAAVARLLNLPAGRFARIWRGPLGQCFTAVRDGRLSQKRLEEERDKQAAYRRRQTDAAASRWHSRPDAVALPSQCPRVEDEEEESFSSTDRTVQISTARADSIEKRAGLLREELYPAWYAKYRHGARLRLVASPLEYQDALSIVQTWDDPTIEKLARIFLTTNDDWISGTDRSFRIFAAKASWADDRLKAWQREKGMAS